MSQEWERVQDEVKEYKIKLEASEREVSKLREVESSLFKTLKTAEDTGANVIDQAHKTAELHLKETQLKVEGMLNEAKGKAKNVMENAEVTSKEMLGAMEERLKEMVESYKNLEAQRDNLISDLNRLSSETIERIERLKKSARHFDAEQHLMMAKRESKKVIYPNSVPEPVEVKPQPVAEKPSVPITTEAPVIPAVPKPEAYKPEKSFFDEIQ
ncbi:MAG: cell division protein DivIVA [Flammeovirgaceae bacterium]|nr:cell division protein DivIVA [Flammeovirgaceae bacterium]